MATQEDMGLQEDGDVERGHGDTEGGVGRQWHGDGGLRGDTGHEDMSVWGHGGCGGHTGTWGGTWGWLWGCGMVTRGTKGLLCPNPHLVGVGPILRGFGPILGFDSGFRWGQ